MTDTDITALAERLRRYAQDQHGWPNIDDTCMEAADVLEALQAALTAIAKLPSVDGGEVEMWNRQQESRLNEQARAIAIRALKAEAALEKGKGKS